MFPIHEWFMPDVHFSQFIMSTPPSLTGFGLARLACMQRARPPEPSLSFSAAPKSRVSPSFLLLAVRSLLHCVVSLCSPHPPDPPPSQPVVLQRDLDRGDGGGRHRQGGPGQEALHR